MRILLAEDTKDLNRNITLLLQHENYDVDSAFDGAEALDYLKTDSYDCVILDIMMPRVDGLTVLKELRARHILTPVLLLTAKAEIDDRVTGLDAGADDYLSKPFAFKELLARVRALIRRQPLFTTSELRMGDIILNTGSFSLSSVSTARLSHKEFEVMMLLMSNADIALSTEYLLEHVWRNEPDAQEDTVWLYISYLKRKLLMIDSAITILGEKGGSFRLLDGAAQ